MIRVLSFAGIYVLSICTCLWLFLIFTETLVSFAYLFFRRFCLITFFFKLIFFMICDTTL